jgi:hypothetical protein
VKDRVDPWRDRIATIACCIVIFVAASTMIAIVAGLLLGRLEPSGWLATIFGSCLTPW